MDFYEYGVEMALEKYAAKKLKKPKKEQPQEDKGNSSFLKNHAGLLGTLAGAGLGYGVYKGMRTPRLSKDPALAAIQQKALNEGLHILRDYSPNRPGLSTDPVRRFFQPKLNEKGELDDWNKALAWLNDGSSYTLKPKSYDQVPKKGVVAGPYSFTARPEDNTATWLTPDAPATHKKQRQLDEGGKGTELAFLDKHKLRDLMPETIENVGDALKDNPNPKSLNEWRDALAEKMKNKNFFLKPVTGVASSGQFPHADMDWDAELKKFHDVREAKRPEYEKAYDAGPNAHANFLKDNGIYPGYVLDDAKYDPKRVMAQKMVEDTLPERRVHVLGDVVPPELVTSRHPKNVLQSLIPDDGPSNEEIASHIKEHFVNRMPEGERDRQYALDVLPYKKPDGTHGMKIVELNPAHRGSYSGLADPDYAPLAGHTWHKALTGRHTEPMSLAAAIPAGLATAGMTAAALGRTGNKEEDEE